MREREMEEYSHVPVKEEKKDRRREGWYMYHGWRDGER